MLHIKFKADKNKREITKREITSELMKLGHSPGIANAIFWNNSDEMHNMELHQHLSFKEIAQQFNQDATSQFKIGEMYLKGVYMIEDYVEAYKWLNLAAAQGHRGAKRIKKIIEKYMTKQQIAEGQRLSREWFNEHQ